MYTSFSIFFPFIRILLLSSQTKANAPARASPSAHTDLICHTAHASECYPAIFQPTERFQLIHADQSIPPGLHIRMNLATGLKEARLNVPEPEDAPKADLVIIDNPPAAQNDEQMPLIPGLVKQEEEEDEEATSEPLYGDYLDGPLSSDQYSETDEFEDYRRNVATIFDINSDATSHAEVHGAIIALTEFAHSLEWGLAITRDPTLANVLINFVDPASNMPIEVQSSAAQLLGTAIQNNPEALEALLAHIPSPSTTPIDVVHAALTSSTTQDPAFENASILQKRLVFLLYQLCNDQNQLRTYVSSSGLSNLQKIFIEGNVVREDDRDKVRASIANFILDHVLLTIDTWPGKSLHDALPADTIIELSEDQAIWKSTIESMGSWCQAFQATIENYDETHADFSQGPSKAYRSVSEVYQTLDQVLSAYGYLGGCECHLKSTWASFQD